MARMHRWQTTRPTSEDEQDTDTHPHTHTPTHPPTHTHTHTAARTVPMELVSTISYVEAAKSSPCCDGDGVLDWRQHTHAQRTRAATSLEQKHCR